MKPLISKNVASRIALTIAAAATLLSATSAHAQLQPKKPIRLVTSGFGGGTDFVARLLASGMTASLGQQVIVENRGSSVIPGEIVSGASPDGHTLLVTSGGILWVMPLFQKVPYDAVKDFAPVSIVASFPAILAMNPSVPANSVKELIAYAKAKPGTLNYVMTAPGGSAHLAAELFKSMAGINIVPIPYKNTGTAITDLISGRVQMFFSASGPVMPHVKTGKLKALAITSPKPSPLFPELPTVAATLPGYDMEAVYCLFAPPKTPASIIHQLNREVVKVLAQPEIREKLIAAGIEPRGGSPEELGALRKADIARTTKLIRAAGIAPQ